MKPFDYCEYHIDLDDLEMGTFHVLSEDRLDDDMIDRLKNGIKQLSFQYGNLVLKCIEYIDNLDILSDSNLSYTLTDGEVYLLEASGYIEYFKKNPIDFPQAYIVSHGLYHRLRERVASKNDSLVFESLIQEVYAREGLLYGIIPVTIEEQEQKEE